jgi:fibronectin type 3 domain-containing protein
MKRETVGRIILYTLMFVVAFLLQTWVNQARVAAEEVSLAWDANSEPDLAGYKMYRSTNADFLNPVVTGVPLSSLEDVTAPTFRENVTVDGTYYYVVTAYDLSNKESFFSNTVVKEVTENPPAAPQNLR